MNEFFITNHNTFTYISESGDGKEIPNGNN